jgi:hypothetical protein
MEALGIATPRPILSNRAAYRVAGSVIGLGLFASITPTPLYVVAYGSLSVPAILAGVVVTHISLQTTFEIFGSIVAAIGLVVAFEAWPQRPDSHRHSTEPKEAPLEQAS